MQIYIFSSDLERAQSKNFKTLCGGGDMDILKKKKKNSVVWVIMMYSKEFKL